MLIKELGNTYSDTKIIRKIHIFIARMRTTQEIGLLI